PTVSPAETPPSAGKRRLGRRLIAATSRALTSAERTLLSPPKARRLIPKWTSDVKTICMGDAPWAAARQGSRRGNKRGVGKNRRRGKKSEMSHFLIAKDSRNKCVAYYGSVNSISNLATLSQARRRQVVSN